MKTVKDFLNDHLQRKEQSIAVNHVLERSLKQELFPKKQTFWHSLRTLQVSFAALVLALVAVGIYFNQPPSTAVVSDGPFSFLRTLNLRCENDCEDTIIVINGQPQSAIDSKDCAACIEANIWANKNGDATGFTIAGYARTNGAQINLPSQFFSFQENPDWQERAYPVAIGEHTVLVKVHDTSEWNMIEDISCDGDCSSLRVGSYGTVFIDNCEVPPCQTLEITHGGTEWNGERTYSVSIWKQPSLMAENNSPTLLIEKTYSNEDLLQNDSILFEETVDGHRISFEIPIEK